MELAFILLIITLACVSMPIVIIGGAWYLEFWKWSPFWNQRFKRPYYRGLIYDGAGNFIGYFVKTVKSVAGQPTLYNHNIWGSFARPKKAAQIFKHGLEMRLLYRLDLSEAGRLEEGFTPKELVFGDDPKTVRSMLEAESIKKLTARNKGFDYTFILLAILGVGLILVVVFLFTGGGSQ